MSEKLIYIADLTAPERLSSPCFSASWDVDKQNSLRIFNRWRQSLKDLVTNIVLFILLDKTLAIYKHKSF